jgi:hypothetical protein
MYLKRDSDGQIGEFNCPQQGWSTPTQEEIDAYLLARAKVEKIKTLGSDRQAFCDAGLLYSGNTFRLSDESTQNIVLKDNIAGYQSDNVSVMNSTSSYILPAGHGLKVVAGQTVYVSGFTEAANNGAKTVYSLEGDFLVVDETLTDEAVGDLITISNEERYKYYDADEVQIDFTDNTGWDYFFAAMTNEKDRIMRYYCATKKAINDCTTVAQVDAIVIDFAA